MCRLSSFIAPDPQVIPHPHDGGEGLSEGGVVFGEFEFHDLVVSRLAKLGLRSSSGLEASRCRLHGGICHLAVYRGEETERVESALGLLGVH